MTTSMEQRMREVHWCGQWLMRRLARPRRRPATRATPIFFHFPLLASFERARAAQCQSGGRTLLWVWTKHGMMLLRRPMERSWSQSYATEICGDPRIQESIGLKLRQLVQLKIGGASHHPLMAQSWQLSCILEAFGRPLIQA